MPNKALSGVKTTRLIKLDIRSIHADDTKVMAACFEAIGWRSKSSDLFERYLAEQNEGAREVLVAFVENEFAGYITVKWKPSYEPLAAVGVSELQDLNVLPNFRRRGIGTGLVRAAEDLVKTHSDRIGIAVGLHPGYNAAQRLYVQLGYVPDGNGITVGEVAVREGQEITLNDDVVLHLEKSLASAHTG